MRRDQAEDLGWSVMALERRAVLERVLWVYDQTPSISKEQGWWRLHPDMVARIADAAMWPGRRHRLLLGMPVQLAPRQDPDEIHHISAPLPFSNNGHRRVLRG